MPVSRWTFAIIAWFLAAPSAWAIEVGTPDPLFQSDDVLSVKITAPISTLISDRPFEEQLAATFEYQNDADETVALDIQVRTRGRFRRQKNVCVFPPLRLNFKASQVKDTLFHKQDKVKLVTHCQKSDKYTQAILREYLVYRMFNLISDSSFRVRLLNITYIDNENKQEPDQRFGFIIEHRDRLAKRMGMKVVDTMRTSLDTLDPKYTNLVSVFQYMIGNTDFSPIAGAKDDYCCHNHILIGNADELYWSVPYDLDQSGIVNAPHAGPNPRFKLRNVRERLYRGRCINNHLLDETLQYFRAKRPDIEALITSDPHVTEAGGNGMLNYLKGFYRTLDSKGRINREFVKACIGKATPD